MKTAKELRRVALAAQANEVELVFNQIISDAEGEAGHGGTALLTHTVESPSTRKRVSERLMALGFKVGEDHDGSLVSLIVSWDHET